MKLSPIALLAVLWTLPATADPKIDMHDFIKVDLATISASYCHIATAHYAQIAPSAIKRDWLGRLSMWWAEQPGYDGIQAMRHSSYLYDKSDYYIANESAKCQSAYVELTGDSFTKRLNN